MSKLFKNLINCFLKLYHFKFPPAVYERTSFSHPCQYLLLVSLFIFSIWMDVQWFFTVTLCTFPEWLIILRGLNVFICHSYIFFGEVFFHLLPIFQLGCLFSYGGHLIYILLIESFIRYMIHKYFLLLYFLSFHSLVYSKGRSS